MSPEVHKFLDESVEIRLWDPGMQTYYKRAISRRTVLTGDFGQLSTDDVVQKIVLPLLMLLADHTDDGLQTVLRMVP